MDNVLIQVHGQKRLIMFKPSDIDYLYIDGDKSLINNIEQPDFETYPLVRHATYYTGLLQPKDCLFIPGMYSSFENFILIVSFLLFKLSGFII